MRVYHTGHGAELFGRGQVLSTGCTEVLDDQPGIASGMQCIVINMTLKVIQNMIASVSPTQDRLSNSLFREASRLHHIRTAECTFQIGAERDIPVVGSLDISFHAGTSCTWSPGLRPGLCNLRKVQRFLPM